METKTSPKSDKSVKQSRYHKTHIEKYIRINGAEAYKEITHQRYLASKDTRKANRDAKKLLLSATTSV